jgi:N-acetylneuraminate synthase
MKQPTIISEIGGNHLGQMAVARRMVEIICSYCTETFDIKGPISPPVIKFQKRTPRLSPQDYERPHPNPHHAYGPTYGEHREALEFSIEQHQKLKDYIESWGATYSTSVWDKVAATEVIGIQPKMIKVPSARNLDFGLLAILANEFDGELHVSLGMTTRDEIETIVKFLDPVLHRTVLYACTSGYPVAFEDVYLRELEYLQSTYGYSCAGIGFSGHHLGIAVDMAATALGATHIERHFTLDRTWKGTDHAASLEPDGLRRIMRDTRNVAITIAEKPADMCEVEVETRRKLKDVTV